ncbi:MAG TPA: hypothetical protein VF403_07720 [Kofleriaceae bacterium]
MLAAIILIMVVSSVGTIGWVFRSIKRKNRLLHALPRTPIRDLVAGSKVRIIGTARSLGQDVGAHFSGTVCLACHAWISSAMGSDGNSMPQPDDRVVAFKVEDDTGSIEIAVEKVSLDLHGNIVEMTTSHGFGASIIARENGSRGGSGSKYYEDRLTPDSRVAVIGYVVRADDGTNRLTGKPRDPLVIANVVDAFIE